MGLILSEDENKTFKEAVRFEKEKKVLSRGQASISLRFVTISRLDCDDISSGRVQQVGTE